MMGTLIFKFVVKSLDNLINFQLNIILYYDLLFFLIYKVCHDNLKTQ